MHQQCTCSLEYIWYLHFSALIAKLKENKNSLFKDELFKYIQNFNLNIHLKTLVPKKINLKNADCFLYINHKLIVG